MLIYYQNGIPPTIPKGHIDDHKIYTARTKNKKKTNTLISFFGYCH